MIRRPPRSTQGVSSAASDVYKRQALADPNLKSAAYGIVLGGFLPLLAVPFLEKYVTKSRYHTVVGDHEDLKKDLKRAHK